MQRGRRLDREEPRVADQLRADGVEPRTGDLGLPGVGVPTSSRGGVDVDEHCRIADGLWAIGDVTGVALFTHVAKYQARVVADTILGRPRRADYTAVPRVVFAQPEIAAELDLPQAIGRPWTYQTHPTGTDRIMLLTPLTDVPGYHLGLENPSRVNLPWKFSDTTGHRLRLLYGVTELA